MYHALTMQAGAPVQLELRSDRAMSQDALPMTGCRTQEQCIQPTCHSCHPLLFQPLYSGSSFCPCEYLTAALQYTCSLQCTCSLLE